MQNTNADSLCQRAGFFHRVKLRLQVRAARVYNRYISKNPKQKQKFIQKEKEF